MFNKQNSFILKILKPTIKLLLIAFFLSIIHHIIFSRILKIKLEVYTLLNLYYIFGLFSVLIITTLNIVKQKNIDIVGMLFLLLTTVKMICCFILGRAVTNASTIEKYNFFGLFIVFLILETVITIRILNNKE